MVTLKEIFGGFWMLAAGVMTAMTLWAFLSTSYIAATGVTTQGEVIGLERAYGSRYSSYRPKVRFTDSAGREHFVSGKLSLRNRKSNPRATHDVGDIVTVHYPEDRPQDAVLGGFMQHWSFLGFSLFSGAFVVAGFFIFRSGRRERLEMGW